MLQVQQVLADFLFVPGEQLKWGESPVIGSIEQENVREHERT